MAADGTTAPTPEIAAFSGAAAYAPRQPSRTVMWQIAQEHWQQYKARTERERDGHSVPSFIDKAVTRFLGCGAHASGFARVRCKACGDDLLVAFSCKQRGVCSSCDGRRMTELSAHLIDEVIPAVATRQWVLTFPYWLRFRLAFDAKLMSRALAIWVATVTSWYRKQAEQRWGIKDGKCASVSVIQRFGDALVLNPHIHSIFCDGVWFDDQGDGEPVWMELDAPTDTDVQAICMDARRRILAWLVSKGIVNPDEHWQGEQDMAETDPVRAWCTKAAILDRIAVGSRAGQLVARWRDEEVRARKHGRRCAVADGFNIHANVRIGPMARDALERLCRYILRPALCNARLERLDDGRVLARLKRRWSDGTWAKVFEPLDFLAKVCALVPLPGSNLLRYHGQFAPAARWRAQIVPASDKRTHAACASTTNDSEQGRRRRRSWAELLRRAFRIDILQCGKCGGRRELIALINAGKTATRILDHLGIPSTPPRMRPARAPPDEQREQQLWF